MNQVKQLFTRYKMLALVIAVAFIWLFFTWQTEGGFLTPRNLSNLLRQMAITGILACGMVLVIISGEIDLSVGSLLGLLGGLAAILDVVYHVPLLANLSLVALCGLMIGLANGYMTAYLRIPSFIVGLGGMLAFRGILLGITGGTTIAPVSPSLVYVGQGYLPHAVGVGLGVLLFALTLFLTWKQRRNRALHGLAAHSRVRDVLRVVLIGAVLAGFVTTSTATTASRCRCCCSWCCSACSAMSPARPCSAAACMRWAAIWKPRACRALTCRRSNCGFSASWA